MYLHLRRNYVGPQQAAILNDSSRRLITRGLDAQNKRAHGLIS